MDREVIECWTSRATEHLPFAHHIESSESILVATITRAADMADEVANEGSFDA